MDPQIWIIECLKMYKISDKVTHLIMKDTEIWKMELAAGQTLTKIKIRKSVFRGDTLSPLLYVSNDVTQLYTKEMHGGVFKFRKAQKKINHPMYMDITIFETLIQAIGITARVLEWDLAMKNVPC